LRSFDIRHFTNAAHAYDNHVYAVATSAVGPDAVGSYYSDYSMIVNPIAWRLAQARGSEEIITYSGATHFGGALHLKKGA